MTGDESIALVHYDAACKAIATAKSTDEVKTIRNQATAMKAYAKQAKNRQLEIDAAEIRVRAERRLGELIAAQRESVGLAKPSGSNQHKERVRSGPEAPTLADAGIDKHLADRARKLAAMPAQKFESLISDLRAQDVIPSSARLAVHQSSETPEHYTPREIIALVLDCFGGAIDLDPCSNSRDAPTVPALVHYTSEDDGLAQEWHGRVYMNPPYGREIDAWIAKLIAEHTAGRTTEAIALVPARTDTQWFQRLRDYVCCFVSGRLIFIGNDDPAPFPSVIFYLGDEIGTFYRAFNDLGDIWQRIEPGMFAE